ncbi:DUF4349 domain-containing protein [Streptomyces sp. A3M-1-3]|uniref:DUF4349 domain-containing protein n=1 Tax=Streptomyces sp. A3M-1-3 TaxID=2962044 RepID=UPI0020B7CBE3|nr:DUF4349 domain-containing protein [Streptomyces sp. A3M-1-3]MCP3820908.1 DUF4349 domain-containing protein [Streptomyces sp. A3M-1-3]
MATAAVLLTAVLAVGGCGASDTAELSRGDSKAAGPEAAADRGGAADTGAKQPTEPGAKKPAVPRNHIIRTATLTVEVKSAQKALEVARSAAESAGGFVGNETTERDDDGGIFSKLVLRVPTDRFAGVLADIEGTGKLIGRKVGAQDVTEQVVDVDSRIRTQQASVARVREMMDKATKLSDVVMLEGELSTRQADLEALLAQQASLKDRTSMATITLEVSEPETKREEKKDDDPGFLDALGGGWDAFVATLRWITVVIGAVLPFAAAAAALVLLWLLVRTRLPRRKAPAVDAPTAAPGNVPLPRHVPAGEEPEPQRPERD